MRNEFMGLTKDNIVTYVKAAINFSSYKYACNYLMVERLEASREGSSRISLIHHHEPFIRLFT